MAKLRDIFSRPARTIGAPLKEGLNAAADLKSGLRALIAELRSNRDPGAEGAPDLNDFNAVLRHWEIEPDQIPRVVRGLRLRMILFALLGLYGVYLIAGAVWQHKFFAFISGAVLAMLAVTSLMTGAWRIHVLEQKRFEPFIYWFSRIFKKYKED